MRRLLPGLLPAGLTGLLYSMSLSNALDGFPLGIFAWVALVPLHYSIQSLAPGKAFWRGWLTGIFIFIGTIYWVITAMHLYGKVPLAISVMLMLLLATYLGLYVGAYALGITWFHQRWPNILWLSAPSLWVSLEFLRTYLFSGLPWGLLGYSQFRFLSVIQIADLTGVYGVSFLLVLVNVALFSLANWVHERITTSNQLAFPWKNALVAFPAILGVLFYGYGTLQEERHQKQTSTSLRIALIQANIEQDRKWDKAYRIETMNQYLRLTGQTASRVDLVIWPEAATPFVYEQEIHYQALLQSSILEHGTPVLFGSPALRHYPNGRPYLFNSAYLLDGRGEMVGRYDKQHLVPFGEYIPLKSLLFFLNKLVIGIGDFEAGSGPTLLSLDSPSSSVPIQLGVAICYEVIFPHLVRDLAQAGANALITITNDAWFGDTVAPYQHFATVVFRAVENRMAFARAANTGISGFIAPDGRILSATSIFSEQAITGNIPLRAPSTIYTQVGDLFAWACVILTGFLLLLRGYSNRPTLNGQVA